MSRLHVIAGAQSDARAELTWTAWGERLPREEFVQRERELGLHPWSCDGMKSWQWLDSKGSVLSSCETFTQTSLLRGEAARSYAIASVFTEAALRGQGHAGRLMAAVVGELRRSDPLAHAITLYSDVGAPLYERSGFVALPAFDIEFSPLEGEPAEAADALVPETLPGPFPPPPSSDFVLWPDAAQIDWHLARERFYARALKRSRLRDAVLGFCVGARVGGSQCLWTADFKADLLRVLLLTEPTRSSVELLILAARRAAHRLGVSSVSIWEDEALPMLASLPGARRRAREGSLPMLLPLRRGLHPWQWRIRPRALWV